MSKKYLGEEISKLGFGFMRLPMKGEEIDMEQTKQMVDRFMEKGFTYFDTAYVYIGGKSEVAIKEAVTDRYPRESFQVASKLPLWACADKAEMEKVFTESLTRAGLEYFDYYLIHAMNKERFAEAEEKGAWAFMQEKKAEGRIRHLGFSFHDTADVLDEALKKHPETEFVQLQINYADWESDSVQARKCYEVAQKHGQPVIIMEPVKGGTLAQMLPDIEGMFKAARPELSVPSWAVRYCASLENIITVLSGMSNMEQLEDNVSYMADFAPLDKEEQALVGKAVEMIERIPTIPCTSCKYCVEGCPQNIDIPGLFAAMNFHKKYDTDSVKATNMGNYQEAVEKGGVPSACIACGACEEQCPQHIAIIEELKGVAAVYEKV